MPTPTFKRLSLDQFAQLLDKFPFTRQANAVHMHHTWRPRRADFKGHDTIVSMWRFHTQEMGWRDIAQHVTIDPDGFIWLGRNWNLPPASAAGHNGNEKFGPFMFEMIGNFDAGHDLFDGAQRETALQLIAKVQSRFGLATNSLLFHNAMSAKSCPGNGLDYAEILAAVEERKAAQPAPRKASRSLAKGPFPDEPNLAITDAIEALSRNPARGSEPADAELSHHEQISEDSLAEMPQSRSSRGAARDSGLDAATLAALRPHLVNLSMGRFSGEGEASTTPADVDTIFEQHLPVALAAAKAAGHKLRLMFYAHGGLVKESTGLRIAAKHVDWWKKNGVYPIYFVWETGLFETLGQLLKRAQRGAARDLFDFTTDPLIEIASRALGGPRIWGGMKSSAEHAVDEPSSGNLTGGGARYVARQLKKFCDANAGDVELHAVGHSAGAIFHCYFLPTARELGVPTFTSAHFLAPAVRVDTFRERLGSRIGVGQAVQNLSIFTMKRDYERDDNCAGIYRKSLLYLIYYALENRRSTPILGLEQSLRGDGGLKALFGLGGTPSDLGQVVWSVTQSDTGLSASQSETHGGFDDDAPTMNSVARRVLGKADADTIIEYAVARSAVASSDWADEVDWPEELRVSAPLPGANQPASHGNTSPAPARPVQAFLPTPGSSAGSRRALCVGINRYPTPEHQLAGCVADARMWADALGRQGFATSVLVDEQATREVIHRELLALVSGSQAGDVIVFQYAGHGTHVPDLNGDEEDGRDEALCPVDFAAGALYIDDDIAEVFARVPDGVNMTCFMDCCHSGTNSRFAVGAPLSGGSRSGKDERKRYVKATPDIVKAHASFRTRLGGNQRAIGTGGQSLMRDVKFSACLDNEVAWESEGHGEFTLRATRVIAAGIDGLSNEQFAQRVVAEFGAGARQHPLLDSGADARSRPLLQALSQRAGATASGLTTSPPAGTADNVLLIQTLTSLQQLLAQLAAK